MAVPEGKRTEAKMEVQTRAIELAIYTTTICNNNKIFPKRDRWIIANRIVGYALDIMDEVNYANDIYVSTKEDYTERRMAQVRAKSCTAKLLGLIDLAYSKYHIESKRMEHWTRLVANVRALIIKWKKSDSNRYKKFR